MKLQSLPLIVVFLLVVSTSFAQNKALTLNVKKLSETEKDSFLIAERLITEDGNYISPIPIYRHLMKKYPKMLYFTYRLGECYLHKSDEYDKAVEYFEIINEKEPKAADIKYFLGQAYLLTYRLDDAITVFNEYLEQKISKEQKAKTLHFIENCENAKELMANPREATITNIGKPINTEAHEYVPVISADESVMIFTYRGEKSMGGKMNGSMMRDDFGTYFEDVFITYKDSLGNWTEPKSIGENINTIGHDAAIALSPDGQMLFIYKNISDLNGDIYYSMLEGSDWSRPLPLKGKVNTEYWEGSCSLSADGKTLYFSSNKPGGFGGKDLYKATLQDDGSWGAIQNLGNKINTEYDEDAPFIHPDGKTLFFSSTGHKSMGRYDIFLTHVNDDGTFTEPENIGYPINTVDNDIFYVLNASGERGYYSSGKPGGMGGQDIYTVEPGMLDIVPELIMVHGITTLDNMPIEAKVLIYDNDTKEKLFEETSNPESGKYLLNLPSDKNYLVLFSIDDENIDPVELEINKPTGKKFQKIHYDVHFLKQVAMSDDSLLLTSEAVQDTVVEEQPVTIDKPIDELTDADIYRLFGDKTADELIFKVQIAAYRFPQNYTYNHLKGLGEVQTQLLNDGITRFTIGTFSTLNQAKAFNEKVHAHGQDDAFVIALYKGQRKYLIDLIKEGILK